MAGNVPDKIPGVDPTKPMRDVAQGQDEQQRAQSFDQYMQESGQTQGPNQTGAPSPLDLAAEGRNIQTAPPTLQSLQTQSESAANLLSDLENNLNTKNLKLKSPQRYLLNTKLNEANKNIRKAGEGAGAQMTEPMTNLGRKNPITKFLGMVQDSQTNLAETQKQLASISASGKPLQPGKLLLIQVKLSKAQQQLEYSSVVLSKAVDDMKMLFNIQL